MPGRAQPGMIDREIAKAKRALREFEAAHHGRPTQEQKHSFLQGIAAQNRCPVEVVYKCVCPGEPRFVDPDSPEAEIARLKAELAAAQDAPKRRSPRRKPEATADGDTSPMVS